MNDESDDDDDQIAAWLRENQVTKLPNSRSARPRYLALAPAVRRRFQSGEKVADIAKAMDLPVGRVREFIDQKP